MKARFKTRLFWILFCACLVFGCAFLGKGRVAVADEDPKYTVTLTGLARPIDGEAPSFAVDIVGDSTLTIWGSVWGDGDGNFMKYSSDAMKRFYARAAGQDVASFYELDKFVDKEKYYFNAFLTSESGISSLSAGDDVEVILKDKDGNVIDGVRVEGTYIPTWMLKLQMPSGMELPSGLNSSAAIIMISTGAIYGSPTDHIHNDNDVDYDSDSHWYACSVCGARMGEKESHKYYSNEATTWKYEAPTDTKEGKYYITCERSHCDAEYMTITIPKTNTADYKVVETYEQLLAEVAKGTKYIKLKSARGNGQQFVSKESVTSPIVLDNDTADVTIDLNGYGLTFERIYATEMIRVKQGKLTIIDKSMPTTSNYQLWFASSNMQRGIYVEADGELVISNVSMYTYICNLLNQYPVIESEGKLTIQGGRYSNNNSTDIRSNSTSCAILVRGGTATINGGLFQGQSCGVMVGASLSGYPTLTVNYGYFLGDKALMLGANGSAVINGGRFEPRYKVDTDYVGYGVYKMNTAGSLVINGGDFSGRYAGLYIDGKNSSTIINGGCFEVLKGTRIASYDYAALLVPVNPEGSITINHASFYGERCIGAISSVLGEKISLNQIIPTDNRVSVDDYGESYDKTVFKNYHGTDNICVREGVLTGTVQLAHPAWYGSANHLTYTGVVAHLPKSHLTFAWEYKDDDGVWKDITGGNVENYTCTDSSLIGKKIRVKITATGFTGKAVYSDEYEMKKATRGNETPAPAKLVADPGNNRARINNYELGKNEYVISDTPKSKEELEGLWSDLKENISAGQVIIDVNKDATIYVYVRLKETTTKEAGSAYATTVFTNSSEVYISNILLGDYNTNGTIMIEKGKSVEIPISYSPLNSNKGTDYWFEVPTGGVAVSGTGIGTSTSNKTTVASKPATITLTGTTTGTHYLNLYHSEGAAGKVEWQTWKVVVYESNTLDIYSIYTDTIYTDITLHAGEKTKVETPNLLPKCDGLSAYEVYYYFYTGVNEVRFQSNEYAIINQKTGEITALKTTSTPIRIGIGVKKKADGTTAWLSSANPTLTVADDSAILVSSVTLNKSSLTLGVGASEKLTATVAPADATDQKVVFTSNNSSVATVLQDGTVLTYAPGTATITATCGGKSASCTVTVSAKSGYSISGTISGTIEESVDIEVKLYYADTKTLVGKVYIDYTDTSYSINGIAPGDYILSVGQSGYAYTTVPVTVSEGNAAKNIVIHGVDECPMVKAVALNFSGQIGVNFKIIIPEWITADANFYAQMEYGGLVTPLTEVTLADTYYTDDATYGRIYTFPFPVSPKEIYDKVSIKFFDCVGNPVPFRGRDAARMENDCYYYSVSDYIAAGKATSKVTLQNACSALENYGASTMVYFSYETEKASVPSFSVTPEMLSQYARVVSSEKTEGISFSQYTLEFKSITSLRLKYKLSEGKSISDYVFKINDEVVTPILEGSGSSALYVIQKVGISARDLDTTYTFTVTGPDGKSETVSCCALSYCYSALSKYYGNASKKALCDTASAMCLYHQAIEAYLAK